MATIATTTNVMFKMALCQCECKMRHSVFLKFFFFWFVIDLFLLIKVFCHFYLGGRKETASHWIDAYFPFFKLYFHIIWLLLYEWQFFVALFIVFIFFFLPSCMYIVYAINWILTVLTHIITEHLQFDGKKI